MTGQAGWRDRLSGSLRLAPESLLPARLMGGARLLLGSVVIATGAVYARIASLPSLGSAPWRRVGWKLAA